MPNLETIGPGVGGTPPARMSGVPEAAPTRDEGLFRAVLAGPGHSLKEAFASLASAPGVQMLVRHPHRKLFGARLLVPPEEGEGFWEFIQIGDDVYVVIGNVAYRNTRVELVPGDGMIQFYFKLSGDCTLAMSQMEPFRLNRPSLFVYFQPPSVEMSERLAPSTRERGIGVNVRADYLSTQFLKSMTDPPAQLLELVSGAAEQFRYCQIPLSSRMLELVSRLLENPYRGALALMQTEAITIELLCAAIAGFSSTRQSPLERYSEYDLRCLQAARNLLMRQFSPIPTIRQVARATGMNETSLKRGFKAIFGETLFDFSLRCRMQRALTLLRENRMLVARVAEAVGYSHQSSFAIAFHRHFGLCPKDVRALR